MLERELILYKFNQNYLRMLAADLDDSQLTVPAFTGANPPVWILGHLAVATDYAGALLGLERVCPRRWHVQFGPGSDSSKTPDPLPSKAELMEAIESGYQRVKEAAAGATREQLDKPHDVQILKATNLATVGDVVAHLMATHTSFHLAQLSACRRARGKAPLI